MQLQGKILIATAALDGSWFQKAVIFITEHNEKGAVGFVTNKPYPRKLNELEEFKHAVSIDLYSGGPVHAEHIYFLHKKPKLLQGLEINPGVYYGGDFKKVVELLSNGKLSAGEVKVFIGYCGWDAGELESEIEEGSWEVGKTLAIVFEKYYFPPKSG